MIIQINKKYLCLPINTEEDLHLVEFYCDKEKIFEFKIPIKKHDKDSKTYQYYAPINVEKYKGKTLELVSKEAKDWFNDIYQSNDLPKANETNRPRIHFTAEYGWINDPNGLVYYDGEYHLYFQYNPFDTKWENMSWGHAVSTDLLHWQQLDTVLWPDENGTMFSGSAIVHEQKHLEDNVLKEDLVYFYTAAGDANKWSKDKDFTQRIAISDNKGRSLKKLDYYIPTIEKENRDPKVFWHEESSAYIMILWLVDNEFAILRSRDLIMWEISQRFIIDKAWECPDLFQVSNADNPELNKWVFWSADGYYCLGDFDGYTFKPTSDLLEAYSTSLPYAAQTFSGIKDRIISLAWLRTKNENKLYTGAMTIPKELSLITTKNGDRLSQIPVREYFENRKIIYDSHDETNLETNENQIKFKDLYNRAIEVELEFNDNNIEECFEIFYGDEVFKIDRKNKVVSYETCKKSDKSYNIQEVELNEAIYDMHIIFDQDIIEVIANRGMIYIAFEAVGGLDRELLINRPENTKYDTMRVYECI